MKRALSIALMTWILGGCATGTEAPAAAAPCAACAPCAQAAEAPAAPVDEGQVAARLTAAGAESRFATANGVKLHYLHAGKGPAIVLLHGYAETGHMWLPIIAQLA